MWLQKRLLVRVARFWLMSVVVLVGMVSVIKAEEVKKPIFFYGQGCPHCAKVEAFMEEKGLSDTVIWKEIYRDPNNAQEFNRLADRLGIPLNQRGVPLLYLPTEDRYLIGDKPIIEYFESNLKEDAGPETKPEIHKDRESRLTIPILIGAALADSINPCALAVLILLMITTLANGQRYRALFSGLAFTMAIFASYLAMGLGLYQAFNSFRLSQLVARLIAYLAIVLGLLNLKDFLWYGKGFRMEVPLSWRPKLKSLIQSVTSPLGALVIGLLISLFLLPCTSGPYIVVIGMLSDKATFGLAVKYLVLYNFVFVLPMIAITLAAFWGVNLKKLEELRSNNLRSLHLLTSIILLTLGLLMLVY